MLSAEYMPVTLNNGHVMPAWYDLKIIKCSSVEHFKSVDIKTLNITVKRIH